MQIAFLSDIHANLISFEAVLRDLDKEQPDQIIYLGDISTLGPRPNEVIALLKKLDCECIQGNHEEFLLDRSAQPGLSWVSHWYDEVHTDEELDFLRSFKPNITLSLDSETNITCYHGSPGSNTNQILPTTPGETLESYFEGYPGPIYVGGHTHIQMMKQYKGNTIINAGSVGMPFEYVPFSQEKGPRLLPWAEYTLLTWQDGRLSVDLRKIPIDPQTLKESYANSKLPDAMYWWSLWLCSESP